MANGMNRNIGDVFAKLNPKRQREAAIAGVIRAGDDNQYDRNFWGGSYSGNVGHMMPTLPLFGPFEFLPFFMHRTIDIGTSIWTAVNSGTGTGLAVQDANGGRGKFTNGVSDDNYYSYYSNNEVVKLASTRQIYVFMHALAIGDVDQADWFIGLSKKLASGNIFANRVDAVGFYGTDGSALIRAETCKNGTATQTSTGESLADGTEKWLGIHINGTTAAYFFVGNTRGYKVIHSTNLPDDEEMSVWFGCRNGQAVANTMTIGQIDVIIQSAG